MSSNVSVKSARLMHKPFRAYNIIEYFGCNASLTAVPGVHSFKQRLTGVHSFKQRLTHYCRKRP